MSSPYDRDRHAHRRAQRERLLAHRRRQAQQGYQWSGWSLLTTWKGRQAALSRFTTTPKACSCWMCCNERRHGFLTLQEKAWKEEERHTRRWPQRWCDPDPMSHQNGVDQEPVDGLPHAC